MERSVYTAAMLRTRIKICGLTSVDTALAAAAAGADAIGLVFEPKSPRAVSVAQAKAIVDQLPAFVEPVGLFVDRAPEVIKETAEAVGLKTVQLHGQEGPDAVSALACLRVVKAMPFVPEQIQDTLQPWRAVAGQLAGLLLDAPPTEASQGLTGGSGHTFDWGDLKRAQASGLFDGMPPLMLAGGLTPGNVSEAIKQTSPYAVDVSSGVESARGVKDVAKIVAFCSTVIRKF